MNANMPLVAAGLFILFVVSYSLISVYSALYIKYVTKNNFSKSKFWLAVGIVTLAWLVATILSVMFASTSGILVFAVVSMLAIFESSYLLMNKTFKFQGKYKIFYSLALSVIINPVWYFTLG